MPLPGCELRRWPGTLPSLAAGIAENLRRIPMDVSRFDTLTRLIGRGRSRRDVLVAAMASSAVGIAALAPGLSEDTAAKKKKRKKKRCKKDGAACSSDKQCCTSKTKRICDVPKNAGNSDTVCCGGQGAKCGGVDDEGNSLAPFCCIGEAGVRSFVCSEDDAENPNTPGTCIPAAQE
jgi:hypothetical protein